MGPHGAMEQFEVSIALGDVTLPGDVALPEGASGIVLFAHGSGSSRQSPRNRYVAEAIHDVGLGTLLFDLLSPHEQDLDAWSGRFRFNIALLARRLRQAVEWTTQQVATRDLPIGLFGASTGAAAALVVAAQRPDLIAAVVSRGGRVDLAGDAVTRVEAPTLLLVGGFDAPVLEWNRQAADQLRVEHQLVVIPGATHLFEEPGRLEQVAGLARQWLVQYLAPEEDPPETQPPE